MYISSAPAFVARPYVVAARAAVFRVGPCPLGETHVMCDHTAGSIDVGDWDLARDRVVDECNRMRLRRRFTRFCEHPRYQRRIACGRRGCQRGRDQLTKTSRLSTDTYRDPA
jgi:hypothetical protein